jgi:hypothetical protein
MKKRLMIVLAFAMLLSLFGTAAVADQSPFCAYFTGERIKSIIQRNRGLIQ